ncbi:hypothetical protein LJK87_36265 [Paenibacillus sp. P25]|nr:hypothetical protein LJK87_36265 [Paenibacillus sp. P25]
MRTMEKTVGRERLLMTVSQIAPPPMSKEIMNQSDEKVIIWIKQVDDWTHKVLSSPVTGTMDREAMQEMRRHLTQVYSPDMAQKLIDGFYRHDYRAGTYQANSTKAMLNLRSDYRTYELKREQPAPGQYRLMLSGRTTQDYSVTGMQHESAYQVQGIGL